jgi:competence protein ComEC
MKTRQRFLHPAWLCAWFATGILTGIASCMVVKVDWIVNYGSLLAVVGICWFSFRKLPKQSAVLWFIAGVVIGLYRGTVEQQSFTPYMSLWQKRVVLQATVIDDPRHSTGQMTFSVTDIRVNKTRLQGKVWVAASEAYDIHRGDHLYIQGELSPGFSTFQAAMYRGVITDVERPYNIALVLRDGFAGAIQAAVPAPQSDLGIGFLLGKPTLPSDVNEQLQVAGLTHIVVASGYNVTILVLLVGRCLSRISKYLTTVLSALLIAGFIAVTGFSPSMVRAGWVAGLGLVAWYYGRSVPSLVLLSIVAGLTALLNPSYVWGDVSWYLSFLAFAGVLWLSPQIQQILWPNKSVGVVRSTILETTCAQLMTLPLILFVFGELASFALIANILVLPVVPLAMGLTFIAGLGKLVGLNIGWPAFLVLQYITEVVQWIANLPLASLQIEFSLPWLVGVYAVLVTGSVILYRYSKCQKKFDNAKQSILPSRPCKK